ncbi:E3 ubiquitin-protein ligase itt1 [Schizosaccharomyces pombe]|uniref:E3 ubiquitin-protein ligase itt1 n=1 Tax=Schizosaccharomyces pombe (strain 972 / ATCC 24843) TaxID=284812 RepID=ITT1_SCHPO|nr:putative ubiquitin-protein ligase E3 [Schizosaccharomyces pombe]Q9US46.1 RecName: Full=E3 ubiquitin-protein ligase itt1; AltName: Full=RING finger protein itt1; AltName: Full=RING-type E3 ubiquitin transferase itt1 [Schizosaccharomyces pombe 972h-]CAB65614.1 ubiquitin-protein ligase E3 (predicted) [Schizosaccharomyces pombe]|eukprot:NP_593502.1 putative ubiquitin-protein ligase E3 [Schizosaccharomyces pombe]
MLEVEVESDNKHLVADELIALQSIYPEIHLDGNNYGRLNIPVNTESDYFLSFKSPDESTLTDTIVVRHFPDLVMEFFLPEAYPFNSPPTFFLKSSWLPLKQKRVLTSSLIKLWNEIHDCVLFDAIEHVRSIATIAFHLPTEMVFPGGFDDLKKEILAFDKNAKLLEFQIRKFQCNVCFDEFNGTDCFQLTRCGHVSCQSCLRDYYTMCIQEGMFSQIKCIDLDCGKDAPVLTLKELESIVGVQLTNRYKELEEKRRYENDSNIIFCPRSFCQGPSKRDPGQKLAICQKCDFAFCSFCQATWHGDLSPCKLEGDSKKLVEMYLNYQENEPEKALELEKRYGKRIIDRLVEQVKNDEEAEKWVLLNGQRCPTCDRVVERIDGCCHMNCLCGTHFCFLCGAYLMEQNPYKHFNDPVSSCYGMLFASAAEKQRFSENWT